MGYRDQKDALEHKIEHLEQERRQVDEDIDEARHDLADMASETTAPTLWRYRSVRRTAAFAPPALGALAMVVLVRHPLAVLLAVLALGLPFAVSVWIATGALLTGKVTEDGLVERTRAILAVAIAWSLVGAIEAAVVSAALARFHWPFG